jgi:hypothetical protein
LDESWQQTLVGVNRKDIEVVVDFEKYSIMCNFVSWAQKQPKLQDRLTKMRTKQA